MIPGLKGTLLSHDALQGPVRDILRDRLDMPGGAVARRKLGQWFAGVTGELGPACGPRTVFDRAAVPLFEALGFGITLFGRQTADMLHATLDADGAARCVLVVTAWGRSPADAWRDVVHHGIAAGLRWALCVNGEVVRVVDARRTYTRRFAEWNLQLTTGDRGAFDAFWGLLRAEAFAPPGPPLLDSAVEISEKYRAGVRSSLQHGVEDALGHLLTAFATAVRARSRSPRASAEDLFDESLMVVYRVLFLLFAEARGLVPSWHPLYRDSYTIEALRRDVELLPRPRGLWETLQAIARLAHRGCRAGPLLVPPFNGRLFAPHHAPLAEDAALDDGAVRSALLALTTRKGPAGRQRISYGDLGVEQLGGVYERVLGLRPRRSRPGGPVVLVPSGLRKATGSFYTPRSLTEYLVRRTLAPLVRNASADQILALRVVDPAMGSGAFLVAACRYLAAAYETALLEQTPLSPGDIGDSDRGEFRRTIAQRCLYGVDINPTAVQLGRLSLWLATLAGDRPLTFLDHHLRVGNSLAGAALSDVATRPPAAARRRPPAVLPLFPWDEAEAALGAATSARIDIAAGPAATLEDVREKERRLAALQDPDSPLARWKRVADLWCSTWFRPPGVPPMPPGVFRALQDELCGAAPSLSPGVARPLLLAATEAAGRERFFHWTLEFPEVFQHDASATRAEPGFDAVIGNPPWEMLRGDGGDSAERARAAAASAQLTSFTRESGIYAHHGDGHANLYQLFLERSLALARYGGRVGLVLPSGFATDHGCAALRRHTLDRAAVDTFISVENREGLFPIHRGLRFLLLCATTGSPTASIPYRAGIRTAEAFERLPDDGIDPAAVAIPRPLLERLAGPQAVVPDIRSAESLSLITRLAMELPALGDEGGWRARFGRELNATEDRRHFVESPSAGALPVLEGKQVRPFRVDLESTKCWLPGRAAAGLLDAGRTFGRARLAYRDVASATNRLTLIAAVVPAGVVTTHTLFCLKEPADEDVQHFLCAVFNSFVANYLVRVRVSTHVTVAIVDRLPAPRPPRDSTAFADIAARGAAMQRVPDDNAAAAALQARIARLYRVSEAELQHVLDSFPLIDAGFRREVISCFRALDSDGGGGAATAV